MKTKAVKSHNEIQDKPAKVIVLQKSAGRNSLEMVDNSEISSSQKGLQVIIDHSPRMAVQRKQLERTFDTPVQRQLTLQDTADKYDLTGITEYLVYGEKTEKKYRIVNDEHLSPSTPWEIYGLDDLATSITEKIIEDEYNGDRQKFDEFTTFLTKTGGKVEGYLETQHHVEKYLVGKLKGIYSKLLESKTFRELHQLVTQREELLKLGLRTGKLQASYDPNQHLIALNKSLIGFKDFLNPQVASSLIFEMHNAKTNKEIITPTKEDDRERQAAKALQIEWEEWINALEATIRIELISKELPNVKISNRAKAQFGIGWYYSRKDEGRLLEFKNHIEEAIQSEHIKMYDEKAGTKDWIGNKILLSVQAKNREAVTIMPREIIRSLNKKEVDLEQRQNPFL